MATEKNITMKQFNGTDYDTLYPKTIASQIPDVYSKTDTITAETLSQLGLNTDKLSNDAFQQIKTLIDNVQSSTDSKAKIQTGSYVGTGTYGADNPCSLTFNTLPKVLMIPWLIIASDDKGLQINYAGSSLGICPFFLFETTQTYESYTKPNAFGSSVSIKIDGTNFSWYTATAEAQSNLYQRTYYWG